jgi:recombination protein RecA
MWGSPETTTGGLALKFYSSVRLDIRRIEGVKRGDEIIGNRVRVKVVKNKVAAPFKQAEFEILFGVGVDKMGYLIDIGVSDNIVEKAGAFFSYKGERLGQGRDNAKIFLAANQHIAQEIEEQIRAKAFGQAEPVKEAEPRKEEAVKEKTAKSKK